VLRSRWEHHIKCTIFPGLYSAPVYSSSLIACAETFKLRGAAFEHETRTFSCITKENELPSNTYRKWSNNQNNSVRLRHLPLRTKTCEEVVLVTRIFYDWPKKHSSATDTHVLHQGRQSSGRGGKEFRAMEIYKKQKNPTYVCFCLSTRLTSKTITEIILNFRGARIANKFVSSRSS